MDLLSLYPLLRSLWVIWFAALFVGIVVSALWPSRRAKFEDFGRIPLRGDD